MVAEFATQAGADGTVRMREGCHTYNGISLGGALLPIVRV